MATKSWMHQANIINMITNKYEPQQKHRLGAVIKNYCGGGGGEGGNPSAIVMDQNIDLFGPRKGFLTHHGSSRETNKSQINTMMKQR